MRELEWTKDSDLVTSARVPGTDLVFEVAPMAESTEADSTKRDYDIELVDAELHLTVAHLVVEMDAAITLDEVLVNVPEIVSSDLYRQARQFVALAESIRLNCEITAPKEDDNR